MTSTTSISLRLSAIISICWAGAVACSDEDPPITPGAGAGGTGTGVAGSGNAGTGTGGAAGGRGGATGGGAGGAAGAAGAANPATELPVAMCSGISSNAMCPFTGTCSDRPCGLADLGSRDCVCNTTWTCTSCVFPTGPNPILDPPGAGAADAGPDAGGGGIPACAGGVADSVPCSPSGNRCIQPFTAPNDNAPEGCACWVTDPTDPLVWDCDNQPPSWAQ